MKIVHYSASLSRSAGGLFYSVSGLAKAQLEMGLSVEVTGSSDIFFEEDRHQWGHLHLTAYPSGKYGFNPKILRAVLKARADIFHLHGIWNSGTLYGLAASLVGCQVVVSPRGMLDPWILDRKRRIKAAHAAVFERPLLKRATIHALCHSEKESIASFLPEATNRIFVIPNGIGQATLTDQERTKSGTLYLGRLHEKKQVLELIEKWKTTPELATHLLTIAGWGDPSYEQNVRDATNGVPNIDFVGPAFGDRKETLLSNARFFILPSLSEGLPMAVLEAISFGCVPIITKQCNLPELLEENVAICLDSNISNLSAVYSTLFNTDGGQIEIRSQRAINASQRYTWSTIARSMVRNYEQVLTKTIY